MNTATEEFRKNFSNGEEVNINVGGKEKYPDRKSNVTVEVGKNMEFEVTRKSSRSEDLRKKENLVEVMKSNTANLNNSSINKELGKRNMKGEETNTSGEAVRKISTFQNWDFQPCKSGRRETKNTISWSPPEDFK